MKELSLNVIVTLSTCNIIFSAVLLLLVALSYKQNKMGSVHEEMHRKGLKLSHVM